jgi:hypothetical protein
VLFLCRARRPKQITSATTFGAVRHEGKEKSAVGPSPAIAIGFIMTNSGGILATWLLGSLSPPPCYTKATKTLLIFSILMGLFSALNIVYLRRENKKKGAVCAHTSRHVNFRVAKHLPTRLCAFAALNLPARGVSAIKRI